MTVFLSLVFAGLLLLLVDESVWKNLPATLAVIQFTFRLETYIVMAIAGLVVVALMGMRAHRDVRGMSSLSALLVGIVLFGLGLGVWQVWNSNAYYYSPSYLSNRSLVLHYPHPHSADVV